MSRLLGEDVDRQRDALLLPREGLQGPGCPVAATVQRIQYDNVDTTRILTFADSKTVHPAFARTDGS